MSSLFQFIVDKPEFFVMIIYSMVIFAHIAHINPFNESYNKNDVWIAIVSLYACLIFIYVDLFIKHPEPASFIIGLLMTLSLGTLTKPIIESATKDIKFKEEMYECKELWNNPDGGAWIGFLERVLYFIILCYGDPLYIGGILTFKVAAKWEAWRNIVQVPQERPVPRERPKGYPDYVSYLIFRRKWGAYQLNRYLAGTLSNILFAIIGYGFYMWLKKVLDP